LSGAYTWAGCKKVPVFSFFLLAFVFVYISMLGEHVRLLLTIWSHGVNGFHQSRTILQFWQYKVEVVFDYSHNDCYDPKCSNLCKSFACIAFDKPRVSYEARNRLYRILRQENNKLRKKKITICTPLNQTIAHSETSNSFSRHKGDSLLGLS